MSSVVAPKFTALGQALAQQAVEVLVAATLPGRTGLGEVASSLRGEVDEPMLGELAAVVPGQRVHAPVQRVQGVNGGTHHLLGFSAGDVARVGVTKSRMAQERTIPTCGPRPSLPWRRSMWRLRRWGAMHRSGRVQPPPTPSPSPPHTELGHFSCILGGRALCAIQACPRQGCLPA